MVGTAGVAWNEIPKSLSSIAPLGSLYVTTSRVRIVGEEGGFGTLFAWGEEEEGEGWDFVCKRLGICFGHCRYTRVLVQASGTVVAKRSLRFPSVLSQILQNAKYPKEHN